MKINKTKLVVGVLAVAGVASLVGSISGTVAWFQYNTRATAEFHGVTAKCTEFLQVRTVVAPEDVEADEILGIVNAAGNLPTNAENDAKYLAKDGKLYEFTKEFNDGEDATANKYMVGEQKYAWDTTESKWKATEEAGDPAADVIAGIVDELPSDAEDGAKYLKNGNGKLYTFTKKWDDGNDVSDKVYAIVDGGYVKFESADWVEADAKYGAWGTTLDNGDILEAMNRYNNAQEFNDDDLLNLSPVTVPSAADAKDAPLGSVYSHPVCGYEQYDAGTYHWKSAKSIDYATFKLQFRVLDIDGQTPEAGKSPALLAQDLFLTDISVAEVEVSGKKDISSALRFHVSGNGGNAMLAPGAGTGNTVTTDTHGALDLGGLAGDDTVRDVPNNYSWSDDHDVELDYGKDKGTQVAYDLNKKDGNGLYPVNDGTGTLTGGKAFGKTNEAALNDVVGDDAYLTLTFNVWLEGWQKLGDTPSALWEATEYIGAKFNIGMSFGVTTLRQ